MTILEFGVGKSTTIFGNALLKNKKKYYSETFNKLRRENLYECHSIDNSESWIEVCKKNITEDQINENLINLYCSQVLTSDFNGRICTFYESLPNISPDLIYLDAPDQYSPNGDVRGISTRHQDRMPMSADILAIEHFLLPGTLIVVDGRTANARFLKANLQRNWSYYHSEKWDQHFFELQEKPLGTYNKDIIDHCLGDKYFNRFKINF